MIVGILTKQFGTNSIILLIFVESHRGHL